MRIININFEENLTLTIGQDIVQIIAYKTAEHGNVKFGLKAPRSLNVHREEIYHTIKQKGQHIEKK